MVTAIVILTIYSKNKLAITLLLYENIIVWVEKYYQ
jgi:hypothetical protein